MCNEINSDIDYNAELQRAVRHEQLLTYMNVIVDAKPQGKGRWEKIKQTAN